MAHSAAPGPVLDYILRCPNDRNTFHSSFNPTMLGPLRLQQTRSNLLCTSDGGVRPDPRNNPLGATLESERNITQYLQHQSDKEGITFELWITPADVPDNSEIPILAIGEEFPKDPEYCDGTDLYIYQESATHLIVKYASKRITMYGRKCKRARMYLKPNQLQRVALVMTNDDINWFINKEDVMPDWAPGKLDKLVNWKPDSFLQVFPGEPSFTGSLRSFSFYDYAMNASQAVDTYHQGAQRLVQGYNDPEFVQDQYALVDAPTLVQNQTGIIRIEAYAKDFPQAVNVLPLAKIIRTTTHGTLRSTNTSLLLQDDQLVPLQYHANNDTYSLELLYQPSDPYYFSVPYVGDEESLVYQFVALDGRGKPLPSRFAETSQYINILHYHHETNVSMIRPNETLQPYAGKISLNGTLQVQYHGDTMVQKARVTIRTKLAEIEVPDWVEIDMTKGSLQCRHCTRRRKAKMITFLAYPKDIQSVLDSVQYQRGGTLNDTITVEIFDGVRGEFDKSHCQLIDKLQQPYYDANGTLHQIEGLHCHTSMVQVPLNASSWESIRATQNWLPQGYYIKPIINTIVTTFLILILIIVLLLIDKCRRCCARGTNQVAPEEENDDDKIVDEEAGVRVPATREVGVQVSMDCSIDGEMMDVELGTV